MMNKSFLPFAILTTFASVLAGCPSSGARPCDFDGDCLAGEYCGSGIGCTFDCREDIDCSGGATCDEHGRCGGGADAGPRDGAVRDTPASDVPVGPCVGNPDVDEDGDRRPECGGNDCDDDDPDISSLAEEECDDRNVDEDCNPCTVGSPRSPRSDADTDNDMFYNINCCNAFDGALDGCPGSIGDAPTVAIGDGVVCGTDCRDTVAGIYPTATDSCDTLDNDCDELIDEDETQTWYLDNDNDGHGDPSRPMESCVTPSRHVTSSDDCDDSNAAIFGPAIAGREGAGESYLCDALDNDCDGTVDESPDGDGDGYPRCSDCADSDPNRNPGRNELSYECDAVDNDCSGSPDHVRTCSNACGTGSAACTGGTLGGCSVAPTSRPCSNACGSGTETCTGGAWGACSAAYSGVSCSMGCASGYRSCSGGVPSTCVISSLSPPAYCTMCESGWRGSRECLTSGSYADCTAASESRSFDANASWLGHGVGYSSGSDWYVPHTMNTAACAVSFGTLPGGRYRLIAYGTTNRSDFIIDGVWVDFGPENVNVRLNGGWSLETIVDVPGGATGCGYSPVCLWYRGNYGYRNLTVDSVTIQRL